MRGPSTSGRLRKNSDDVSRKERRKREKEEKKHKKVDYFQNLYQKRHSFSVAKLQHHPNPNKQHQQQQQAVQAPLKTKPIQKQPANLDKHIHNQRQNSKSSVPSKNQIAQQSISKQKVKAAKKEGKEKKKSALQDMNEDEDDRLIAMYEAKLGKSRKANKGLGDLGFDDDLFDFLDNIHKKVQQPVNQYKKKEKQPVEDEEQQEIDDQDMQQEDDLEEEQEEEEMDIEDEDLEGEYQDGQREEQQAEEEEQDQEQQEDDEDIDEGIDEELYEEEEQMEGDEDMEEQDQEDMYAEEEFEMQGETDEEPLSDEEEEEPVVEPKPQDIKPRLKSKAQQAKQTEQNTEETLKIRKSLNSLTNKLSQGNIAKIFKEIIEVFRSTSRSIAFKCYSDIFMKFNIDTPKLLLQILASQVALMSGLHQVYDNPFIADVLKKIVDRFFELMETPEEEYLEGQVEFNPILENKKNCVNTFAYLYIFDSISVQFVKEVIEQLVSQLSVSSVELLLILFQRVGIKIRNDDPKVLKDLITHVRDKVTEAQKTYLKDSKKAEFILLELNDIKFNKKVESADQRLTFLQNFVSKNVINENGLNKKVFVLTLQETRNADSSIYGWWEPEMMNNKSSKLGTVAPVEELQEMDEELREKTKNLENLARQLKMVTELRKKIFITIMTSEDYIDAAQKLMELHIKQKNELATVIVEIMSQEKNFNLFYVHLACKLIELMPKFRVCIQFALWDQEKQLEDYTLRKINNLGRFLGRIIVLSEECSIAMLKNLNDLSEIGKHEQVFVTIVLQEVFTEATNVRISELIRKIREGDNNRDFKMMFEEYLKDVYYPYVKEQKKDFKEKVKLAIRLLSIQEEPKKEKRYQDF